MLKIEGLSVVRGNRTVLDDVTFCLRPHRFTALLGKNGSGKSTLIACINRELPYKGKIVYGENDLALWRAKERAKQIAILPQTLASVAFSVRELVAFGRGPYLPFMGRLGETDRAAIEASMEKAGVKAFADRRVDELSGGERQLAYLAMILAQNARLLVLDEPTTFMDVDKENGFWKLLCGIKRDGKKTVFAAMHDLNAAMRYADDLVVLDGGKLRFCGDKQTCAQEEVLEDVFGVKAYEIEVGGEKRRIYTFDEA